jgi:hypothetical protein
MENIGAKRYAEVRLPPARKWGTDWGTICLKVGYGPVPHEKGGPWR